MNLALDDSVIVEVSDLQRVDLHAGEVLIVRTEHRYSAWVLERLRSELQHAFPHNRVLLLEGDLSLAVVKPE